ncbi:MAG: HyaD/HybD family hydrogenase maturation endopeptidase [Methylococcaceae bacterium]|nr:HyaD/HybD family hydrogenase maturation endopeptidase [Methylococcaceae bacterium]
MDAQTILVLGIGNLLWADEGFGVRVVQALQQTHEFPPRVSLLDGGTSGLALIPPVQEADSLIIVDAVDFHLAPGTMVELRDEEVPAYLGAKKMSLHQVSFQEVLALCQLLGKSPARLLLLGVQPQTLDDYGGSLSPVVKQQIAPAMARIIEYLAELGIEVKPKPPSPGNEALDMAEYERQRPSAEEACRFGDARFLFNPHST